jgi:hypothetical protein
VNDDLWQSYLSVKTQAAADFVKSYLWDHSASTVATTPPTVRCRCNPNALAAVRLEGTQVLSGT